MHVTGEYWVVNEGVMTGGRNVGCWKGGKVKKKGREHEISDVVSVRT